jgi:cytoplasmic iron level regulating protein YaaA (DUF328/UPF0246 family)
VAIKILFSPSESKNNGGDAKQSFIFNNLLEKREFVFNKYKEFLQSASEQELQKLFGIKKDAISLKNKILESKAMPAIERYCGVAYDYLDYKNLPLDAKEYVLENTIIFSNLFGPLLAKDSIINYKLKQGENFCDFKLEEYYLSNFSNALDGFISDDFIIDLRAGFYDKFYKPKKPFTTLKFLQNGKVVSHYAKAYRGIVLKELAKANVQNKKEFLDLKIDSLSVIDIKQMGLKEEIAFAINLIKEFE